jgi:hypothetical protein
MQTNNDSLVSAALSFLSLCFLQAHKSIQQQQQQQQQQRWRAACRMAGFALGGYQRKARTSLIMGCATSFLIALCGVVSRSASRATARGAVHATYVLCVAFSGVFLWRASVAFQSPSKAYVGWLLTLLTSGSLFCVTCLCVFHRDRKVTAAPAAASTLKKTS